MACQHPISGLSASQIQTTYPDMASTDKRKKSRRQPAARKPATVSLQDEALAAASGNSAAKPHVGDSPDAPASPHARTESASPHESAETKSPQPDFDILSRNLARLATQGARAAAAYL